MGEHRPGQLVELVDTLLRNLGTIEQSITSGKEREAALAEISLLGAFVQRGAFLLRGPKFRAPTDTLMRVANGVLGFMARTETDAGMLEREPPDAKLPIPMDIQKGRAIAAAVMEFLISTKRKRRIPAAKLVVTLMGSSRLFDGLKGERWRVVDNWRAALTGAGTAGPDAMGHYRMALDVLLRTVPPEADVSRLTVLHPWRKKPAAAKTS